MLILYNTLCNILAFRKYCNKYNYNGTQQIYADFFFFISFPLNLKLKYKYKVFTFS